MKNFDKTFYDFVRDNPIEESVQSLYNGALKIISPDPCIENKKILYVVKDYADLALEKILQEDAKCRPTTSWLAAVGIVERIRDDVALLIGDLDKIFENEQ